MIVAGLLQVLNREAQSDFLGSNFVAIKNCLNRAKFQFHNFKHLVDIIGKTVGTCTIIFKIRIP